MGDGSGIRERDENHHLIGRLSEIIGPRVFLGSLSGTPRMPTGLPFMWEDIFPHGKKCPWTYLDFFVSGLRDTFVLLGSISFFSIHFSSGLLTVGIRTPFEEPSSYSEVSPCPGTQAHACAPFPILLQDSLSFLCREGSYTHGSVHTRSLLRLTCVQTSNNNNNN